MIAAGSQSVGVLEFLGDSCAVTAGSANLKISPISEMELVALLKDAPTDVEVLSAVVDHIAALQTGCNSIPFEQQSEIKDQSSKIFKLSISKEEEQLKTCISENDDLHPNL